MSEENSARPEENPQITHHRSRAQMWALAGLASCAFALASLAGTYQTDKEIERRAALIPQDQVATRAAKHAAACVMTAGGRMRNDDEARQCAETKARMDVLHEDRGNTNLLVLSYTAVLTGLIAFPAIILCAVPAFSHLRKTARLRRESNPAPKAQP